jgi:hypothetical protein
MIVVTVLDDEEEGSPAVLGAALVPPHTLEPGYSHLYSIPPQLPQHPHYQGRGGAAARVTLAFSDNGDDDNDASAVWELLLRSGDRLRVAS